MHTCMYFKADKKELFCSFIYVHNRYTLRRALWRNLNVHTQYVRGRPWCLLRNFNAALHLEDKSVGSSTVNIGDDGILKKIDRIMSKLEFHDAYMGARAMFQPYRISDHSPAVIKLRIIGTSKLRPFKYSNILVRNTQFKNLVREGWNKPRDLDADPFNIYLHEEEAAYVQAFNDALITQERFLKKKAKIEWLHV
ncbi:RNA-directed DNA polymerase, eukaryota, reverse transcriptase zinc-binding domain protein, partial [Tanacetum coccineum]